MIPFIVQEYEQMKEAIREIWLREEEDLRKIEQSYRIASQALEDLRQYILQYTFADQQEEINFFKETKPRFLKELIYYRELYHIEARMPVGPKELQESYCLKEMERISIFFHRNQEFYTYIRTGKTHRDLDYFLRNTNPHGAELECTIDIDRQFCTAYSFKLAKLQAFEQLNTYLQ